uniref:WGS project CAEQ00000000 data, annotated contig 1308 n=1 Tax=Trypanosoma congolense (strain IL3000) TaxID=1068625 RepID=F9W5C2_TRYCI|nr:unnamed protein product [Trypanosoma congolense IL3000]
MMFNFLQNDYWFMRIPLSPYKQRAMQAAYDREEVGALIRQKGAELGGTLAALSYVHNYFRSVFSKEEVLGLLYNVFPMGDVQNSAGRMCRCRGMIQEMDPNITLYRASSVNFFIHEATDECEMLEAVQLYVIPVPGNVHFYDTDNPSYEEGMRGQGAAACVSCEGQIPTCSVASNQNRIVSRKRRERTPPGVPGQGEGRDNEGMSEGRCVRLRCQEGDKLCDGTPSGTTASMPLYQQLNLPHPPLRGTLHTACIVTVIFSSNDQKEQIRLNDVVDFYGFIDESSLVSSSAMECTEVDEFECFGAWHSEQLPPGVLPRMTCLSWQNVYAEPVHPLNCSYFETRRPLVLQYLKEVVCAGDCLLAEYLLLHLCARVTTHEGGVPIGDLPLRVEGDIIDLAAWSSHIRNVSPVAEVLLDSSKLLDSSLSITSRQDGSTNILKAGILQLANGSHVTLDSRAVDSAGDAVQDALFAAIHKQVLLLEYPYQTHEIPVDLNFLVLSTSRVADEISFLRLAVSVPWIPELATEAAILNRINADDVRDYFAQVRRVHRRFEQEEHGMASRLSDRLLAFSHSEPHWNNRDPFIHNNSFAMAATMMRAHAASLGREIISDANVDFVLNLEHQRVRRCHGRM